MTPRHLREASDLMGERADCGVVALAAAFDLPYDRAHAIMKRHGRKDKRRVALQRLMQAAAEINGSSLSWYRVAPKGARTVSSFARTMPKGTYLVAIRGHFLCIRDYRVLDHTEGTQRRIRYWAKV